MDEQDQQDSSKKRKAEEIADNEEDGKEEDAKAEDGDDSKEPEAASIEPEAEEDTTEKEADTEEKADESADDAKPPADVATSESQTTTTAAATKNDTENTATSNAYDKLRYIVVKNDGTPEAMIKLVGLKSLFSRQLPKMPRAYIARLVFDRRHESLAILSDDPTLKDSDEEIIGGICFRPFYDMRFAEIAFCAVSASHQVKGYGTKLMNLVKQLGAERGIEYYITYADNYAIGYFKKQGFTKNIAMPKGRYLGLIKDYDGGTMMECYVHPSIDFTRIPEMIKVQRQFILDRIALKANSHKVYDPLPKNFNPKIEGGVSRGNEAAARAMAIPGMAAAGWTMNDLLNFGGQGKEADRQKNALKNEMLTIVRKIEEQQFAWPFREPVDIAEVPDYATVIKEPIDLSTIEKRIKKGEHYKSKKMLHSDLMLMVNNCKLYNDDTSAYVSCAHSLEKYLTNVFADV